MNNTFKCYQTKAITLLIISFAFISSGHAQQIELIGHYNNSHGAIHITLKDNYAYIGAFDGLLIVNITDPANPSLISFYPTANMWVEDVFISGNYAFITQFVDGFKILNISDPYNPVLVGSDSSGTCHGLYIRDNYAYLAACDSFKIADISNLTHPVSISRIPNVGECLQTFVVDSLAYVKTGVSFEIFNISDVLHPHRLCLKNLGTSIGQMALRDTVLYLTTGDSGLMYFSIANPVHPRRLGRTGDNNGGGIAIYDTFAFVGYNTGIRLYRIESDGQLLERARHEGYDEYDLSIWGDHIYGLSEGGGMDVFDFPIIPCHYSPGNANGIPPFNSIDIMYDVNFLRGRGPAPPDSCNCPYLGTFYSSADANGNCEFNSLDITFSVNYLKGIGPAPVPCPDCPPR